jgi:peptide/nickel transport system substrate-binding protein
MAKFGKRALATTAVATLAVATLAACGSSGSGKSGNGSTQNAAGTKGGTLTYYINKPIEHLDPQRVYVGRDITNLSRTVYRQLVGFPISTDPKTADTPVPDLATDTGTATDGAKTWSFTLKDGVKWQDGTPITCEDLKYGASRAFATDVITGGPNYILSYLDLPKDPKTGLPDYTGPYNSTPQGQADFDKAITCSGNTITYHFNKPWPDFPLAIAALHMMDPFEKAKDQGDKSNYDINSDGPYMLQGTWNKESGGTLVRNPNYDPKTDSTDLRKALPDKIVFNIGKDASTTDQLFIHQSGDAETAVTSTSIAPSDYAQITGNVAKLSVNVPSPFNDYLLPNFNRLKNPLIRQALAVSTNTQGWIQAGGGSKAYAPSSSIVNPAITGYQPNPAFPSGASAGDTAKAKQLLQQAGVPIPYPIKFTYNSTPTADKQAAALQQTWNQAGFKVTLDPLTDTYYDVIQKPTADSDVIWGGWGADWPSAITVTPPLFDSRPNLTKNSNGQDYGNYKSDAFNALVDKAANATSLADQTAALQQADILLGKDYAYIPLEITKFYYLRGSKVTGYMNDPASNMYPDLGSIGVQH